MSVASWSTSASSNTNVGGVAIGEGCARANMNDMGRAIMAEAKTRFLEDGLVDDSNAAGDGITDDQTIIATALADTVGTRFSDKVYKFNTGNLSPVALSKVHGAGRENTFLRCGHASNPAFSSTSNFVIYEGFSIDRSGAVAGQGISHAGASNAAPVEGFIARSVNTNGHASGIKLRDFVIAHIEDCYLQSCTTGLDTDKTGANYSTLLSVKRCWIRGNVTTGALIAGVKNSHFEQTVFEGTSGTGITDVGIAISGGDSHLLTNCWWEAIDLAGTFTNLGQASLYGGYLDGSQLDAHAFSANGATTATTVTFDGPWEVQNFSGTFAIADQGATIIVRAPALLGLTFSAVNGGKVIFECPMVAKATWNPPNIAALTLDAGTTVTVTGARLGDICTASFENGTSDPAIFQFKADCFANDTVTVRPFNMSGGAVDMASGTLSVSVIKRPLIS